MKNSVNISHWQSVITSLKMHYTIHLNHNSFDRCLHLYYGSWWRQNGKCVVLIDSPINACTLYWTVVGANPTRCSVGLRDSRSGQPCDEAPSDFPFKYEIKQSDYCPIIGRTKQKKMCWTIKNWLSHITVRVQKKKYFSSGFAVLTGAGLLENGFQENIV